MKEISSRIFFSFRSEERKKVKLTLRSHEGLLQVKLALIEYLTQWNGKDWIDWEQIELVLHDLGSVNFWKMLPYQKFLTEIESKISLEIITTLRTVSY